MPSDLERMRAMLGTPAVEGPSREMIAALVHGDFDHATVASIEIAVLDDRARTAAQLLSLAGNAAGMAMKLADLLGMTHEELLTEYALLMEGGLG